MYFNRVSNATLSQSQTISEIVDWALPPQHTDFNQKFSKLVSTQSKAKLFLSRLSFKGFGFVMDSNTDMLRNDKSIEMGKERNCSESKQSGITDMCEDEYQRQFKSQSSSFTDCVLITAPEDIRTVR